jgi:hypothetical protein
VGDTINSRLTKVNSVPIDRKKLITYGGYIVNPYLAPGFKRYAETTAFYPMFLLSNSFPAHFGREHPVLEFLNRDITNIQVSKKIAKQAGTPFVYVLNDGICPVSSAIFLPNDVARTQFVAKETDFEKVRDKVNVGKARVFRNVDHLTFIDGVRPINPIISAVNSQFKDELNPQDGQKDIFDWILSDLVNSDHIGGSLAKTKQVPEPVKTAAEDLATAKEDSVAKDDSSSQVDSSVKIDSAVKVESEAKQEATAGTTTAQ